MNSLTLGLYLHQGRLRSGFSPSEVAYRLELESPLTVLTWERNKGEALPLPVLERLIPLYGLDVRIVFDLLLQYQLSRIEEKLNKVMEAAQ